MTDNYVELLVKKKTPPIYKALSFSCMVLCILQVLLVFLSLSAFFVVTAVIFWALGKLVSYYGNIEYEYLYLDKNFSIDKIHNRRKRKKVAEYELDKVMEIFAPCDSPRLDYYKDKVESEKDYTSGAEDAMVYCMVVHVEKRLEWITIEADEELIKQISLFAPRKVFKD